MTKECPGPGDLAAYQARQLSGEVRNSLAAHVVGCARCTATLRELQDSEDSLVALIKGCTRDTPLFDDPEFLELEARARALGRQLVSVSTDPLSGERRAPAPVPEDVATPAPFGKYELCEKLGQGAMGVVYKARQGKPLNRVVALKMVRAGAHAAPQALARFRVEVEALARLDHPNVVTIYEFNEEDGKPYFTMELVEGGSLADRLGGNPLPPRQAAQLVRALAQGVHAAHRRGIVHRDLKPGNVLLTADGTPKVTDFGLAKLVDGTGGQTESGTVLGTPSYMAPEQALGKVKDLGTPADVYALGAILYETLTGRPPFQGGNRMETLARLLSAELVAPSRLRPGLSPDLEAVCLKCLEKEPANRYTTAQALAEDLGRWLDGKTTLARPRRWPVKLGRSLRRFWLHHPLISASPLLVALGILLALYGLNTGEPDRPTADPDHALNEFRRDLARLEQVTVLPDTGRPKWFRWAVGQEESQVSVADDNTFAVHAGKLGLLELLPEPVRGRYRFRMEVRHDDNSDEGDVGLYFGHRLQRSPSGRPHHCFYRLGFSDCGRNSLAVRSKKTGEPGSRVRLSFCHFTPIPNRPQPPSLAVGNEQWFRPARPAGRPGPWRQLAVDVTPEEVQVYWWGPTGKKLTPLNDEPIAAVKLRACAANLQSFTPEMKGLDVAFPWRGALGLYLYRGSASFRRVVCERLVENNQ
jgi:serine/threonine-protein kinase